MGPQYTAHQIPRSLNCEKLLINTLEVLFQRIHIFGGSFIESQNAIDLPVSFTEIGFTFCFETKQNSELEFLKPHPFFESQKLISTIIFSMRSYRTKT